MMVALDELKGYTVIQEGEGEILMQSSNTVFFNKAQVNNRDMSIAVLRTFISKRKEEHAALQRNKTKGKPDVLETNTSESGEGSDMNCQNVKLNGESDLHPVKNPGLVNSEDSLRARSGRTQGELKPLRVLEALAASGLRSLRYAREVDGIDQVVALDNDKASIEACKKNIQFNGAIVSAKVEAHLADARVYMLTHPKEFDVVDLDPYGSPSVFLDLAV